MALVFGRKTITAIAGALTAAMLAIPACSTQPSTPPVQPPENLPAPAINIEQIRYDQMYNRFVQDNPEAIQYQEFSKAYVSGLKDLLELRVGYENGAAAYNDYVATNIANVRWNDIMRQVDRGQWLTPLDDASLKERWSDPEVRENNLKQIAFPTGLTNYDFSLPIINSYKLRDESDETQLEFIVQNLSTMYEFDTTYPVDPRGPFALGDVWSEISDPTKKQNNIDYLKDWWSDRVYYNGRLILGNVGEEAMENLHNVLKNGQEYEITAVALNGYMRSRELQHDVGIKMTTYVGAKFGIPVYQGVAELKSAREGFHDGFQVTALSDATKELLPNATIGKKTNGFGFYSASKQALDTDNVGWLQTYMSTTFDKLLVGDYLRK